MFSSVILPAIIANAAADDPLQISEPLKKVTDPITGASGARAQRDAMSEQAGAQADALKAARDRMALDRSNNASAAARAAARMKQRQAASAYGAGAGASSAPNPFAVPAAPGKTLIGQ